LLPWYHSKISHFFQEEKKAPVLREFKTLLPYVKRYRHFYIFGLISLVFTDAGELYIPQLMRRAVDIIAEGSFALSRVGEQVLMMIATAAMVALFRFGWRYFLHGASRRIERDLRRDLFSHLLTLSPSFYRNMKTGDIMARSTNDMRAIRMASGMAFVAFVDGFFLSVAILVIIFTRHPRLAAVTILPLPLITIIVLLGGKLIGKRFREVQEGFSKLSEQVRETLSGIRVVKSFVRESWAEKQFHACNDEYLEKNMRLIRIWGLFFPLITFISGLSLLFLLIFGGKSVILGEFSPGEFVAFMSYLTMLRWPVMGMGFMVNMLQRGAASLGRINAVFKEKPDIVSPRAGLRKIDDSSIELRELSYRYDEEGPSALDNISFSLEEGKTLGILGKTGSGKTTLVRLFPRLNDPPQESLFIGGRDVHTYDLETLRRAVGVVPQETFLFSATIKENLSFGKPGAGDEEIRRAAAYSTIDRELASFPRGWETEVGERGLTLSGGQKQRVAISRAMLIEPEILIFDDALASVDAETEEKILGEFLSSRKGKTNILVAHRVSTLQHADYIIVLDEGRIIEEGSHGELSRKKGLYRDIMRLQQYSGGRS
jgi:ATP-binding cassette, subfamily B, multidrug efflux pump